MNAIKKARRYKKSKAGTYISIGTSLFGAISVAKQVKQARSDKDTLVLADAVISAAAITTGVLILLRELRNWNSDDILTGD
ncbi:hypothetical protein JJV70_05565 [Streptomyces sp. JJ66]|uniref:hypothetical protein n=1 Tax=Streptomyces sp. JJ66 TaxID=2803843 RepID=UPI001C5A4355|nr:hypothetical protein [Streptomyces sp. JJ66]MBW1601585.1 hypothetical protein [Streptomyces sp. JJ66]